MFLTCESIAATESSASCLCLPNGPDEAGTFAPTPGDEHRTTFCNSKRLKFSSLPKSTTSGGKCMVWMALVW